MDPALRDRIYQYLAGRGGWRSPETRKWGMRRFERMDELGFNWDRFGTSLDDAELESERFVTLLRDAGAKTGTVRNFQKNLLALARFHRHRGFELQLDREPRPQPAVYTRAELDGLHGLPYRRNLNARLDRALSLTHMAFGLRPGELAPMRDLDLDPKDCTFFVAFPEKGGPKRRLRPESEVFLRARPLMAYLEAREAPRQSPNALWVEEAPDGSLRPLDKMDLQRRLAEAGRTVGVRANCTRGRHTRATALIANDAKLPYASYWLGHTGPYSAIHKYVELDDAGMASHLVGTAWLRKSDRGPRGPRRPEAP